MPNHSQHHVRLPEAEAFRFLSELNQLLAVPPDERTALIAQYAEARDARSNAQRKLKDELDAAKADRETAAAELEGARAEAANLVEAARKDSAERLESAESAAKTMREDAESALADAKKIQNGATEKANRIVQDAGEQAKAIEKAADDLAEERDDFEAEKERQMTWYRNATAALKSIPS